MSDIRDFCRRLAQQMPSTAMAGVDRIEIEYRWYFDDSEEGPFVRYFDLQGVDLGNKLEPSQYLELSDFMLRETDALRRASTSQPRPNVLMLVVGADGSCSGDLTHSPQIDVDYEQRQREALGNAAYERFENERIAQEAAPPTQAPAAPSLSSANVPPPTVPELLGFIRSELLKDVPANWDVLDVEGEVWTENGQQSVSTVYHYVAGDSRQRFTATNQFGPMNAVIHLHEQFRPEGKPWRKITLQFKRDSTATLVDTQ